MLSVSVGCCSMETIGGGGQWGELVLVISFSVGCSISTNSDVSVPFSQNQLTKIQLSTSPI